MNKKSGAPKRGAALIFLAACVLFSLLVLGGSKLSSLRAGAMQLYEGGEQSILADLAKHNENAYNIITVGKRLLGDGDAAVKGAEDAYKAMNGASGPAAKFAADAELDAAIATLVARLDESGMNQKDAALVNGQKADMYSRDMIISHSEYNARVTEYAQAVSGFPGSMIAALRGLSVPEYYR